MKNRVEELRRERGLNQGEFARAIRVSRQTVSAIETGKYNPALDLAFAIAKFFGKSIEDVFEYQGGKAMYCEKCSRVFDGERCPVCGSRRVREPADGDLCFLAEQDYLTTSMLEDVLKQENIPFLTKGVMGAGLAIKAGPTLERTRFYVPFERLQEAEEVLDELTGGGEETEE